MKTYFLSAFLMLSLVLSACTDQSGIDVMNTSKARVADYTADMSGYWKLVGFYKVNGWQIYTNTDWSNSTGCNINSVWYYFQPGTMSGSATIYNYYPCGNVSNSQQMGANTAAGGPAFMITKNFPNEVMSWSKQLYAGQDQFQIGRFIPNTANTSYSDFLNVSFSADKSEMYLLEAGGSQYRYTLRRSCGPGCN